MRSVFLGGLVMVAVLADGVIPETFVRLLPVGGALLAVGAALLLARPVRGQ